jgi:small conductance mechanosensitive channel
LSIIVSRPFKVGDTVTIKEYSGLVDDIRIPFTVLLTPSGEKITIPNKQIVGEVLINSFENKMFETAVGISYSDDPNNAIRVIREALKTQSGVLQNPAPFVGINSFGDSSINLSIKYWTQTKIGGSTRADVNLAIFYALQKSKISIPFPQREVRMLQN